MNLSVRVILVCLLLGSGLAGQTAFRRHLEAPGPLPDMPLAKPLADLPTELGNWKGEDRPIEDDELRYADENVFRNYWDPVRNQSVVLWIAYSRDGVDRGHHPEVCMAVAGKPEDRTVRRTCPVEGPGDPVQQYRFGHIGDRQWVFYWHYTLPPPPDESLTKLQRIYRRFRRRPSSMTIEVFAPEHTEEDGGHAQAFVRLVDAALREYVGPTAIRSSQRLPITLVDPEAIPKG